MQSDINFLLLDHLRKHTNLHKGPDFPNISKLFQISQSVPNSVKRNFVCLPLDWNDSILCGPIRVVNRRRWLVTREKEKRKERSRSRKSVAVNSLVKLCRATRPTININASQKRFSSSLSFFFFFPPPRSVSFLVPAFSRTRTVNQVTRRRLSAKNTADKGCWG